MANHQSPVSSTHLRPKPLSGGHRGSARACTPLHLFPHLLFNTLIFVLKIAFVGVAAAGVGPMPTGDTSALASPPTLPPDTSWQPAVHHVRPPLLRHGRYREAARQTARDESRLRIGAHAGHDVHPA